MAEVSVLRTEIKTWERNFKAKNGRDPSIQDIRDQPAMADKYKLYKKLSKAAAAALVFSDIGQSIPSNVPPSTPPRAHSPVPRPSLIRSNKRKIESSGPLSTFNPFSPVKNKGKQKESSNSHTRSDLFTTPVKAHDRRVEHTAPSLDPFPVIRPLPSQVMDANAPTHAVSRARKRLRGEPVSPSPAKEKRPRIASQSSLSVPTFDTHSVDSDRDHGLDDDDHADSSFVNDSPVKRPGNKSFNLLFEETVPQHVPPKGSKRKLSRVNTNPDNLGLSAYKPSTLSPAVGSDTGVERKGTQWKKPTVLEPSTGNQSRPSSPAPGKADRSDDAPPRRSGKRTLSDYGNPSTEVEQDSSKKIRHLLLPPSPPPADPYSSKYKSKIHDKGLSRKKAKMLQEMDGDGDEESSEDCAVKLVDVGQRNPSHPNQIDADPDAEPLFGSRYAFVEQKQVEQDHAADIQVNLPERLRHMLAISPPKTRDRKEEQLVHGLLHGMRPARYDPRRGGEIWEVGEGGEEFQGDTDGEDDWEAEPVPWAVGEL